MTHDSPDPRLERLQLAERISDWLDALDLDDDRARTALATGLAGLVAAATDAHALLDGLLATEPLATAEAAEAALELATELNVQLLGELRERLADVDAAWPALEDRLIELGPDDA